MTAEDQLQIAVAELLDHLGWCWTHAPNEGRRSPVTGALLKRKGLKRGVPDVLIFERWRDVRASCDAVYRGFGIAIELKVGRNKTTKEQDHWLAELRRRGWLTAVCRSLDEVIDVCRAVLPLNCRRLPPQEDRRGEEKAGNT